MATVVALVLLSALVNADLAARVPGIETPFGWRKPPRQQTTTRRVVWTPGDESGSLGTELGATKVPITIGPNQTARNLADLDELFHCQIQAHDPTCPDDESGQYTYTRLLYDERRAAVYRAAHGTRDVGQVHINSARWITDNTTEFRRGAAIVVTARIRCPIPDNTVTAWAYPETVEVTPATADLQAVDLEIPIPTT